ncbi:MAG: Ig-like domain-containing protein [Gemmatimonadetes bacterium]|nr:Ig-like domain-containing protein [Gemmatimonadota bacterium]
MVFAVACADATTTTGTPSPTATATGLWDYVSALTAAPGGYTCVDSGTLALTQQGTAVAGRAEFQRTCGTPGSLAVSTSHEVDSVSGTVGGNTLRMERRTLPGGGLLCSDTLTLAPSGTVPPLAGNGQCTSGSVTWSAVAGAPIASATMRPDALSMLVGSSQGLVAEFRTATGMRAYQRGVTWATSNAAAVTVNGAGMVVAAGTGNATITAVSGGRTASASIAVPAPAGFAQVGAGNARTCALSASGAAWCWGVPAGGVSGGATPVAIGGGRQFVELAVGANHACGRTAGNAVWCWGAGTQGQLGDALFADAATPQLVASATSFTSITAGGAHSCGLTAAGAAWCWGADSVGQLGRNGSGASAVPVAVAGGLTFTSLSAGPQHTCGVATTGALYCWGDNTMGQLGDSTTTARAVPTLVKGGLSWSRVATGAWRTCALTTTGAAYCWGSAGLGSSLGTGHASDLVPAPVTGGLTFSAIAVGGNHACAIDLAKAAWCWGTNSWGQVGNGASGAGLTAVTAPAAVAGGLAFATISTGSYDYSDEAINGGTAAHTCGVTTGGITWCWGVNNIGQLGTGASGFMSVSTPVKVIGQP